MSDELKDYTTSGWKTTFNFDFGTDPPDAIPKTKFQTGNILFSWPNIPTTDEITDKIDHRRYKYVLRRVIIDRIFKLSF